MSCPSLLETPLPRGGSTRRSKNKANSVPRRRRFTLTRVSTRGSFLKRHDYTRRNTRTASVKNLPCTLNLPWLNDLLSNSGCVLFLTWRLDFSWISGLQDLQRPWQDCHDLDKYDWETKMDKIQYWKRTYATQQGHKNAENQKLQGAKKWGNVAKNFTIRNKISLSFLRFLFFFQFIHSYPPLGRASPRSRRLEVVGTRKHGRARRRRSLFRPLLPSACYAGAWSIKPTKNCTATFPRSQIHWWSGSCGL